MHEVSYIWVNYFWSSLKGNGPEALIQTVVYGVIAALLVPVFRKWFKGHMASLHEKIDHVIRHSPHIPDFEPKEKP